MNPHKLDIIALFKIKKLILAGLNFLFITVDNLQSKVLIKSIRDHVYYILFIGYCILCFIYTYERMLNTDCSLQFFQIVNSKNFFFQENRFGVWFTQIPLISSTYTGIPINWLIYIYSLSFPLFYFIIILINDKIFKCREAALATILCLTFGVAFTFYHSITETHQLLAISCLLFGLIQSNQKFSHWQFYSIFYFLVCWCLFTHPNAIFVLFFLIILGYIQSRISMKDAIIALIISLIFIGVKLYLTKAESYDAKQYASLAEFNSALPDFFSLYSFRFLILKYDSVYFSVFLIIFIVFIRYKKIREITFTSFCFIGFTVLTIFTFKNGDCDAIMEKSYMPGFFMFIILFSQLYYREKSWLFIITFCLGIFSFYQISKAAKPYAERLSLLEKIMQDNPQHPKLIASFSDFDENISRFNNWATSMDALTLSVCRLKRNATIFMVDNKLDYAGDTLKTNTFLYLPWNSDGLKNLNPAYYNLPEGRYHFYQGR